MRKITYLFIFILLIGRCAIGQGTPSVLDFTAEESAQLKEIGLQRVERQKESKAAGEAIATAKTDEDAIKYTLRFQLAGERLAVLQLAEMLTVANAKIRLNCLDCEYKDGMLVKPEPVKK